jgi:pimeloyl-ACP methyl ester carboxylesterase
VTRQGNRIVNELHGSARSGEVEIYFESFGDPTMPTLLLVNGIGSQCINYDTEWCRRFNDKGFRVIRFDNRDVGLSSKLDGRDYSLAEMADDAVAVLDEVDVSRAHVMGCSLGGMIVQRLAIDHPDRLLSVTSVMSRTGEPGYGDSSEAALKFLLAPPPTSRAGYIERQVAALHVYGSKPEWLDDEGIRTRAGTAYDRSFCPAGFGRQLHAALADEPRAEQLRNVTLPVLVIHGSRDTLIDPSGGRRTAEVIPGARYVEIEGMGHDYPPAVWDQWVAVWSDFVRSALPEAVGNPVGDSASNLPRRPHRLTPEA